MKIVPLVALAVAMFSASPALTVAAPVTRLDGLMLAGGRDEPQRPERPTRPDRPSPDQPGDQGVDGPDSSTGNDDRAPEPPHLICRFAYTDAGVVVVVLNTGGPIPPWMKMDMTWDEPTASSLTYTMADGMPGNSKFESVPLNWDPDGMPCIVTLSPWNP